jgi:hypothetical protein
MFPAALTSETSADMETTVPVVILCLAITLVAIKLSSHFAVKAGQLAGPRALFLGTLLSAIEGS